MGCAECPDATHWNFVARDPVNDIDEGRTDQGLITQAACITACENDADCDAWFLTHDTTPRCYTYDFSSSAERMFTASCTSSTLIAGHEWKGQVRSRTLQEANHRIGYFAAEGACTLSPVVQWLTESDVFSGSSKASRFELSNWDMTATLATNSNSAAAVAHATLGKTAGKWYQEVKVTGITPAVVSGGDPRLYVGIGVAHGYGIANPAATASDNSGLLMLYDDWDPNSASTGAADPILIAQPRGAAVIKDGTNYPAYATSAAPWSDNDVIGIALDADAGTLHFYHNGVDLGEVDNVLGSLTSMSSDLSSGDEWHVALGDATGGNNGGVFKLLRAEEAEYPTPVGYSYWSSTTPTYAPAAVGESCDDGSLSWGRNLRTDFTAHTGYDPYHDCKEKCDALGPSKCDGYQVIHSGTSRGQCEIWSESLVGSDGVSPWTYSSGSSPPGSDQCGYKTQVDFACTLRYSITPCPTDYYFCNDGSGGTCYEASTACFGSCPSMGNWAAPAYDSSYASFQTYCASWSANSGTFNGGRGRC